MTCIQQLMASQIFVNSEPPPTPGNVFQLRTRTLTITYAAVYTADVPGAVIFGNDANPFSEEWITSFNPNVINGTPDRSIVTLTGLGSAAGAFTRQPAIEGARYWEVAILDLDPSLPMFTVGLCGSLFIFDEFLYAGGAPDTGFTATHYEGDGELRKNSGIVLTGAPLSVGDIVGVVASNPSLPNAARFYINGVFVGAADIDSASVCNLVSLKLV